MTARSRRRAPATEPPRAPHEWVGAALVGLGRGDGAPRAERAARTGHHVLPAGVEVEVLEVYCARCRVRYSAADAGTDCYGVLGRRARRTA